MTTSLAKSPFARPRLLRDASWQAVHDAMRTHPEIHVFGEGAEVKARYDAPAMLAQFPGRIHTLPISEDGNLNACVGMSLLGITPICDLISQDFSYRAMDSIVNTAAKLARGPFVIRMETLQGGPTTGQRNEAALAHVPGLRVAYPSTPHDSYGLMASALRAPGVTVFIEDRTIEDSGPWEDEDLDLHTEQVVFGKAKTRMMGQRGIATIVTYGVMRQRVERLLRDYKWERGDFYAEGNLRADLIDLRSIYPLDIAYIKFMLARTSRLLVIEPDVQDFGVGAEIVACIAEEMPHVKVKRLGARRQTVPAAASLHKHYLPSDEEIISAITTF